jgi:HK97 family phage major capsid protein
VENTNLTPEQVIEKLDGMFTEKMTNVPTNEDVKALKDELEALKGLEAKNQDIEKSIAKFEGRIEAMSEKAVEPKLEILSVGQAITKAYADNIDEIKSAVEKGGKIALSVKDTDITNDYTGDYALTDFDTEVDRVVRKRYGIMDAVNRGTTSSKFVTYVQQTAGSTGAWTGESASKTEQSPSWAEISEEVKKIAGYVKVSKEMLEDLSFVRGEINNDLLAGLSEQIEEALINGSGIGSVINGLLSVPMALPTANFGATPFNASVQDANQSDCIRIAKAVVEQENFTPTHVILNPIDIASLQLTKESTGGYTYPMYIPMQGEMRVADMIVVSSNYITAGTYIVGDMSKVNVKFRNDLNLSVGLDQDDFTRNMITILAEARLVQYVKENQKNAFLVGDFDADILAINKP